MDELHSIDRIDTVRTDEELESLMVFCLLDRANLYETVCRCYNILEAYELITRKGIQVTTVEQIEMCLRSGGIDFLNRLLSQSRRSGIT